LANPTWEKKNTVVTSLRPNPPMEMGSKVIADIIGKKIKKTKGVILTPKDNATK